MRSRSPPSLLFPGLGTAFDSQTEPAPTATPGGHSAARGSAIVAVIFSVFGLMRTRLLSASVAQTAPSPAARVETDDGSATWPRVFAAAGGGGGEVGCPWFPFLAFVFLQTRTCRFLPCTRFTTVLQRLPAMSAWRDPQPMPL